MRNSSAAAACLAACLAAAPLAASPLAKEPAAPFQRPRIETNQSFVDEATRPTSLDMNNPMAVLSYVLAGLPDRVKVYPTENYFYFKFHHGGQRYAGNLRLDVLERDRGKVNFAYFKDLTEWSEQAPVVYRLLGPEHSVEVKRLGDLLYRVSYGGRSVVFELNDLRHVKPGPGMLAAAERYIGPVFDESGVQFLLVYNSALKTFHYILDERVTGKEPLKPAHGSRRILIGQRTGFAYYQDHKLARKILVGVHASNARVNNYFDGPFDQLPDNFIEGEALRSAILEVEPRLKGKIDMYGISPGGADRYMIAPYLHYRTEQDLLVFHACATSKAVPAANYHACFVVQDEGGEEVPPTLAAQSEVPEQPAKTKAAKTPVQAAR